LTGDDRRIVVGMDKNKALLAGERVNRLARRAEIVALQHDAGAERFGAVDLDERRALGHQDRRRDAEPPCVISDTLSVIARGHSDHPGVALTAIKCQQLVECTPLFERSGAMQCLELQMDLSASKFAEPSSFNYRGMRNRSLDARGGFPDRFYRYGQVIHTRGGSIGARSGTYGHRPYPCLSQAGVLRCRGSGSLARPGQTTFSISFPELMRSVCSSTVFN
jgi:hypothetical protein